MTPIINPWIFYLMNVSSNLSSAAFVIAVFSGVGTIILYAIRIGCFLEEYELDNGEKEIFEKCKKVIIIFFISLGATVLIPSRETMIEMIVVSQITPDNIATVGSTVTDTIDYLIEKVDEILEE